MLKTISSYSSSISPIVPLCLVSVIKMSTSKMADHGMDTKLPESTIHRPSSSVELGEMTTKWGRMKEDLRQTFLTKEGWLGDYVRLYTYDL